VEVVQLIVKEPSETAFPVTDVIARADAKGAARARIALTKQCINGERIERLG
jgi:hypothetical protein